MRNISPDKVKAQLESILSSSDFTAGKQLSNFLSYVVEQTLNGQSESIKQYTIGVEALGYGVDFDTHTNPTVRVVAQRLRRALDRYYNMEGMQDPIRIDIPKGSYIPHFTENHKAPKAKSASVGPSSVPAPSPLDSSSPSIAVVMFGNLNKMDESIFLAQGLTGEILISLTRFSGLRVLGPLLQAEDERIDYYKIRYEYGAMFVLQGWVRGQGKAIRITIDLTDASTGAKQWGRTFEYDLEKSSLFEIEDEVTSQVVGEIADGVGIIFQKLQSETYHEHIKLSVVTMAVLKYNHAWMTHDPLDWRAALEAIRDVLEKEPANALLMALLANTYYGDVIHELKLAPDVHSQWADLAQKAVSLDPNLQVARYNLVVQHAYFGRAQKCVEEARRVVAMNPNHALIVAGCGSELTTVGEYDLGKQLIERAKQLNPHYPSWYHFVDYVIHFRHEQYAEAWTEALKIHVEGLLWHPLLRAAVLGKLGRTKEAKVYLDELLRIRPDFPTRPRAIIKLIFVIDEHVEMILDGLRKAGIRELQ